MKFYREWPRYMAPRSGDYASLGRSIADYFNRNFPSACSNEKRAQHARAVERLGHIIEALKSDKSLSSELESLTKRYQNFGLCPFFNRPFRDSRTGQVIALGGWALYFDLPGHMRDDETQAVAALVQLTHHPDRLVLRLRRCANEKCKKWFFAVRTGQKGCNKKCTKVFSESSEAGRKEHACRVAWYRWREKTGKWKPYSTWRKSYVYKSRKRQAG